MRRVAVSTVRPDAQGDVDLLRVRRPAVALVTNGRNVEPAALLDPLTQLGQDRVPERKVLLRPRRRILDAGDLAGLGVVYRNALRRHGPLDGARFGLRVGAHIDAPAVDDQRQGPAHRLLHEIKNFFNDGEVVVVPCAVRLGHEAEHAVLGRFVDFLRTQPGNQVHVHPPPVDSGRQAVRAFQQFEMPVRPERDLIMPRNGIRR